MGDDPLSDAAYRRIADKVEKKGSATFAGEQRHKEGKGLHELVDPKGYGVIRRSLTWLEPKGNYFVLYRGVAMLIESRSDTTGSMKDSIDIAMKALPRIYKLVAKQPIAVLGRYDVQVITGIFADVCDNYVMCRSQAEVDERIAEQMTYMVPEGDGGDSDEDPQYGLFGAAYLTQCDINKYGLKSYDFTITDARGRSFLSLETLKRVFGESVMEKVEENGYQIDGEKLPSTREVVQDLLKISHAFLLQVRSESRVTDFWREIYGKERVVILPETKLLPEVQAAIIGLTEGVLTLQTLEKFLVDEAGTTLEQAKAIKRAVAHIPIGAQAELPGFDKIPLKGEKFAKKGDIWPMKESGEDNAGNEAPTEKIWK